MMSESHKDPSPNSYETISERERVINELITGKISGKNYEVITKQGLLDLLLCVQEEGIHTIDKGYIQQFCQKYEPLISKVKKLLVNVTDFHLLSIIGRGHFGEVRIVKEKATGNIFAMKTLIKADILAQENAAFYQEERAIMANADSHWLIKLQYAFQDSNRLHFVMEFAAGGDLLSLLTRYNDIFEERMAKFYIAEMAEALNTLHLMGYVHRDLKPENVLIDATGHLKLADFGSACRLNDASATVSSMVVGTPDYISPEMLSRMNPRDSKGYVSDSCDWWSLGVCSYEMLFGSMPFTDTSNSMIITYSNIMNFEDEYKIKLEKLEFPNDINVSDACISLIKSLLTHEKRRYGYSQVVEHNFFRGINFKTIRQELPPFIPSISSKEDVSHFEEIKLPPQRSMEVSGNMSSHFIGRGLPFVGFTYSKQSISSSLDDTIHADLLSVTLKMRVSMQESLDAKCSELDNMRKEKNQLELKEQYTLMQKEQLEKRLERKEEECCGLQEELNNLNKMVKQVNCDKEKLLSLLTEKSSQMKRGQGNFKDLSKELEICQKRETNLVSENAQLQEDCDEIRLEKFNLEKRLKSLELEYRQDVDCLKSLLEANEGRERENSNRESSVISSQSLEDLVLEMQNKDHEYASRENQLRAQLDQVIQKNEEAQLTILKLRQEKGVISNEMKDMKSEFQQLNCVKARLQDAHKKLEQMSAQRHRESLLQRSMLEESVQDSSLKLQENSFLIKDLEEQLKCNKEHIEHYRLQEEARKRREEVKLSRLRNRATSPDRRVLAHQATSPIKMSFSSSATSPWQPYGTEPANPSQRISMNLSVKAQYEPVGHCDARRHLVMASSEEENSHLNTTASFFEAIPSSSNDTDLGITFISDENACLCPHFGQPVASTASLGIQVDLTDDNVSSHSCADSSDGALTSSVSSSQQSSSSVGDLKEDTNFLNQEIDDLRSELELSNQKVVTMQDKLRKQHEKEHEQRIRALDLKLEMNNMRHRLQQNIEKLTADLSVATTRVAEAENRVNAVRTHQEETECRIRAETEKELENSRESLQSAREEFMVMQRKLTKELKESQDAEQSIQNKLQRALMELDTTKLFLRGAQAKLREAEQDNEIENEKFTKTIRNLKESEKEAQEHLSEMKNLVKELRTKVNHLEPAVDESEAEVDRCCKEIVRLENALRNSENSLAEKQRLSERQDSALKKLQETCVELEKQVEEYDQIITRSDERLAADHKQAVEWEMKFESCKLEVKETTTRVETLTRQLQKMDAQLQESRNHEKEMKQMNTEQREKLLNEIEGLYQGKNVSELQVIKLKERLDILEIEKKSYERNNELLSDQNEQIKTEATDLISKLATLRSQGKQLEEKLNDVTENRKLLEQQNLEFEELLSRLREELSQKQFTSTSTIEQQQKLITYLQAKMNDPSQRCRRRFKIGWIDDTKCSQCRENHFLLEQRRNETILLKEELVRMRDRLHASKINDKRNLTGDTQILGSPRAADYTRSRAAASTGSRNKQTQMVTPSKSGPSIKNTSSGQFEDKRHSDLGATPLDSAKSMKPRRDDPTSQNVHKFANGLSSRPTKCAVCLGSVHFVKMAARCQECQVVCHPKCAPSLGNTCGSPTVYAKHLSFLLTDAQKHRKNVVDMNIHLEGWVKIPRAGKQLWDRRYMVLDQNKIFIYERETKENLCLQFDLRDSSKRELGQRSLSENISIHSSVSAAELVSTMPDLLPYTLKIERDISYRYPDILYVACLNFEDKHHWVAALEAIICYSLPNVLGSIKNHTHVNLVGEERLEANCSYPLEDKIILVGCDEGLFAIDSREVGQVVEIGSLKQIYQIIAIKKLGMVLVIMGHDRDVVILTSSTLFSCIDTGAPSVSCMPLVPATACTVMAFSAIADDVLVAAALAEKIIVFKWSDSKVEFVQMKEVLTTQACSCLTFSRDFLLFGADKFYRLDLLQSGEKVEELLDSSEPSLAFAAMVASNYASYPIAALMVAEPGRSEEWLLCFHEFGVFVDSCGRRTRPDDMQWWGSPLAFAYEAPFMFIFHFNGLQVIEILPSYSTESVGSKSSLILAGIRYLGPAPHTGSIYLASLTEDSVEISQCWGCLIGQGDKENLNPRTVRAPRGPAAEMLRKKEEAMHSKKKGLPNDGTNGSKVPPIKAKPNLCLQERLQYGLPCAQPELQSSRLSYQKALSSESDFSLLSVIVEESRYVSPPSTNESDGSF